jgi:hypothetical protein
VDETGIYWSVNNSGVFQEGLDGGVPTTLAVTGGVGSGSLSATSLALGSCGVFWISNFSGENALWAVPKP